MKSYTPRSSARRHSSPCRAVEFNASDTTTEARFARKHVRLTRDNTNSQRVVLFARALPLSLCVYVCVYVCVCACVFFFVSFAPTRRTPYLVAFGRHDGVRHDGWRIARAQPRSCFCHGALYRCKRNTLNSLRFDVVHD